MARVVATLVATAVALLGDGAAMQVHAPSPPPSSHPPMSVESLRLESSLALGIPRTRATLGAAARWFVENPSDSRLAARLLELARSVGREDWLRDFARASARRLPTAATLLLSAELQYSQRGNAARLAEIRRAYRAVPDDAEIAITFAVALGVDGKPLQAFAALPRRLAKRETWATVSDLSLQRLAIITSAAAPDDLGDVLTTVWLRRSWRSRSRSARAQSLAFAAALAVGADRETARQVMAEASLVQAAGSADAEGATIALMNAGELTKDTSLVRRFEGACAVIPEVSLVARTNCLVAALQHAVFSGAFSRALGIYARVQEQPPGNPLMALRLNPAAMTLLELNGDYRGSAELATVAAAAAGGIGNRDLEGRLLVRLARSRRLSGDLLAAQEAALRASTLNGTSDNVAQQAERERMAAERGARGEPPWPAIGEGRPQHGDALLRVLLPTVDLASGGILTSSGGDDLDKRAFAPVVEDLGRALVLETEQRAEEALSVYLRAVDYVRSHLAGQAGDLLEAATLADVWQDITRRALGLALASGRAELGLRILEAGRNWTLRGGYTQISVGSSSDGQRSLDGSSLDRSVIDTLPRRTALVAYAVETNRTWAAVLRRRRTTLVELPLAPSALRDQVALWRELAKVNGSVKGWQAIGQRLAHALLTPLEVTGSLDGIEHVWFVPDDVLHLIPFATLVTLSGEDPVGYGVSQFPSIASALRKRNRALRAAPLVAFGASGGAGTLKEMLSIRRLGGRVLVGARATETAWKRESLSASAIHFGGHATQPGESRWATALQLKADSANDGLLTIAEILALPLRGAVVVLLGCDTAARPEQPGPAAYYRQVPSISEAFLEAGASAVVGNLWPITEEDAQFIAEEFYGAGGPARGAIALEEARTALRRRFPDTPRRWAGSVWLGAAKPLPTAL
ncbi:MAG: CHAT domain-containing protein, partial [Acidobacteriota bacterium]